VTIQALRKKGLLSIAVIAGLIMLARILVHDLTLPMRSSPGIAALRRLRGLAKAQKEFRAQHGCFASDLLRLPDGTSQDHDYAYTILPQRWDDNGCITKSMITAYERSGVFLD
jgi:hypothetical protein